MAVDMVIKNGRVVTPTATFSAGIAVDKGKIVAVAEEPFLPPGNKVIDARDKLILPGLVDPHFHLGYLYPFDVNTLNESKAAAAGGVTTSGVFMPNMLNEGEGIIGPFREYKRLFEENSLTDGFFHAFVLDEGCLEELPRCPEVGITSFKFLLGYKGPHADLLGIQAVNDGTIFAGFRKIAKLGRPAWGMVHAENIDIALRLRLQLMAEGRTDAAAWHDSRPNFCEAECIQRCLYIARVTDCPLYIVHTTIWEGVDIVAQAKAQGIEVVAETCPQYLTHNSEEAEAVLKDNPSFANVNPPLRDKASNEKLWKGLRDGIIECVGSDHSAMTVEQKGKDIWNAPMGLGNVAEMILPVMLSEGVNKGRLSINKVVEVCCSNPARVFGVYPRKGTISAGSDADMVIVDLEKRVKVTPAALHSVTDWSIYDGWEFKGWPVLTILRGKVIVEDGVILGSPGNGRYIRRECK